MNLINFFISLYFLTLHSIKPKHKYEQRRNKPTENTNRGIQTVYHHAL